MRMAFMIGILSLFTLPAPAAERCGTIRVHGSKTSLVVNTNPTQASRSFDLQDKTDDPSLVKSLRSGRRACLVGTIVPKRNADDVLKVTEIRRYEVSTPIAVCRVTDLHEDLSPFGNDLSVEHYPSVVAKMINDTDDVRDRGPEVVLGNGLTFNPRSGDSIQIRETDTSDTIQVRTDAGSLIVIEVDKRSDSKSNRRTGRLYYRESRERMKAIASLLCK